MIARVDIRWFRFGRPDKQRPVVALGRGENISETRWSEVRGALLHVLGFDG